MAKRNSPTPTPNDPGLQTIAAYEAAIVQLYDDRTATAGASADELTRERSKVVELAAIVAARLREEYRARTQQR